MAQLKVKHLSKRYDQRSTKGVSDISFELDQGETLYVLGPSGAGKSTLLDLLEGNISPDSGEIGFLSDEKIVKLDTNLPPQSNQTVFDYLCNSLSENIAFEQKENLVRTELLTFEITNEMNSNLDSLSTGQRQRVNLAKLFLQNPTIALFDEAFTHLDTTLKNELLENIKGILKDKGITSIWVTHDYEKALSFSNKILLLNFGQVEDYGEPERVFTRPRNLFTARSFGKTNTILTQIKEQNENSVFVEIEKINFSFPKYHGLQDGTPIALIIRPHQFKIDDNGKLGGNIEATFFHGDYYLNKVKLKSQSVWMTSTYRPQGKVKFNIDDTIYWPKEI